MQSRKDNTIIKIENDQAHSVYPAPFYKHLINVLLLLLYFVIIPLVDLIVGVKYYDTTTCTYKGITGISVLIAQGILSLCFLMCMSIQHCLKNFSLNKTLLKNLRETRFAFKIITILYTILQLLFMIFDFVIVDGCTNHIIQIEGTLIFTSIMTIFAAVYILYKSTPCFH